MSKDKMQAAKELIQKKQYEQARAILKTVDDPKAREWLAKLPAPKQTKTSVTTYLIVILLAGIPSLLIGLAIGRSNANPTPALMIVTATAEPISNTPVPAAIPTSDCGAYTWWNETGSIVIDFMSTIENFELVDDPLSITHDVLYDSMSSNLDKFDAITPPLCAHDVQTQIVLAMYDFLSSFREKSLNAMDMDLSDDTPESYMASARSQMREAGKTITGLTGVDTSFMQQ